MAEDKPRLIRLTTILTQLQSKRIITAREIAEKHNVSLRTVYRDIKALEQSGVPIMTEEGKGYAIMEGYRLPPVMFSEEEANALITVEQLVLKNKDQSLVDQYQNATTKIKSVLKFNQKDKADLLSQRIQVRNNQNNDKTSKHLIELQSHIANFQVVQIEYLSLEDELTQRLIEPFAIFTTQENWILIAFCRKRKDYRAFRLDRIHELIITSEKFQPHQLTLEKYFEECRKKGKYP